MTRRAFITLLGGAAVARPLRARAQQPGKVPTIGFLVSGRPASHGQWFAGLAQRLRELGWIEGRTVAIEYRFAQGREDSFAEIFAEFVRRRVDVIVTSGAAILAAKQVASDIPIVFAAAVDPVSMGLVASLARPGGNITGLSNVSSELSGKRLELLKEAVPGLVRVGVLWDPDVRGAILEYKETEAAARSLRLELRSQEVSSAEDLERAFSTVASERTQALILVGQSPVAFSKRTEIANFARRNRLPTISNSPAYVDAGGLMSYGQSITDGYRRTAIYVDKVLKGVKPADLPVEQPTKFELIINLKTAKALGLTLPRSLLQRADHLIE